MASLATTTKRISKHKVTRGGAWVIGLAAAAAAAVGGLIWYDEKSAKAATPKAPPVAPPGPAPAGQVPVWAPLTPQANPNVPGTFMVQVPANATFVFADDYADPNLNAIVAGLTAAVQSGAVTGLQNGTPGTPAPPGWPADGFSNGYRVAAVAAQSFVLGLGPLSSSSPTSTPGVWIVTGFQ